MEIVNSPRFGCFSWRGSRGWWWVRIFTLWSQVHSIPSPCLRPCPSCHPILSEENRSGGHIARRMWCPCETSFRIPLTSTRHERSDVIWNDFKSDMGKVRIEHFQRGRLFMCFLTRRHLEIFSRQEISNVFKEEVLWCHWETFRF